MCLRVYTQTIRCYTWRKIGPVVVVDEAGRHAMEVTDMSKTKGTEAMPIVVPDPSEVGGVKAGPETDKESL